MKEVLELKNECRKFREELDKNQNEKNAGDIYIRELENKINRNNKNEDDEKDNSFNRYHEMLDKSFEVSSMGIRVNAESLDRQLTAASCDNRRDLPFHKALLAGELPLTMGGGIGQSRLCMLLLGSAHIGEVQSSVWDAETRAAAKQAGVPLL